MHNGFAGNGRFRSPHERGHGLFGLLNPADLGKGRGIRGGFVRGRRGGRAVRIRG